MPATWSRESRKIEPGSHEYWEAVICEGLPSEDWSRATCEGDQGHGPCGSYIDWVDGRCIQGHEIEFDGLFLGQEDGIEDFLDRAEEIRADESGY